MRLNSVFCIFFVLISDQLFSSTIPTQKFQKSLDQIFRTSLSSPSQWSCTLVDLESQNVCYELNPSLPLIPASNQKLITLCATPPTLRTRTIELIPDISPTRPIENNRLQGNLIIAGFGAIHFTSRYLNSPGFSQQCLPIQESLRNLAIRIRSLGIKHVEGGSDY